MSSFPNRPIIILLLPGALSPGSAVTSLWSEATCPQGAATAPRAQITAVCAGWGGRHGSVVPGSRSRVTELAGAALGLPAALLGNLGSCLPALSEALGWL